MGQMQRILSAELLLNPLFPDQYADNLSSVADGFHRLDDPGIFLGQRFHMLGCHTNLKGSGNSRLIFLVGNHADYTFLIRGRAVLWIGFRYHNGISGRQETVNENVRILQIGKIGNGLRHIFNLLNISRC